MGKACPKCESKKWMTGLKVPSAARTNAFVVLPTSWGLGKGHVFIDTVSVCADCGYAELQAANHAEAWEEWRKHHA